jgi:nucleotide-binding universal stress UspA family protein
MIMSHVVLGLLPKTETAPAILAGAERLAVLLGGARIEAMVMRILPISTIMPTEEILSKADEKKIRDRETDRAAALRRIFDAWATKHGGTNAPRWIDEEGITETLVKTWGERADYIVVGRPDAHADRAEHDALHAALFASECPVLMMPPQAKTEFGKTIAVAWREDKFTLHAVLAALRCLPQVSQVHVLMGRREGDAPPKIPDVLAEHGIAVTAHELPIGKEIFGAQLLAAAHEHDADLLVMGAFVHNAWHNLLFGGVTKYILTHADIPVLMRH